MYLCARALCMFVISENDGALYIITDLGDVAEHGPAMNSSVLFTVTDVTFLVC